MWAKRCNPPNFQNVASPYHKLSLSLGRRLKRLWLGVVVSIGLGVQGVHHALQKNKKKKELLAIIFMQLVKPEMETKD